MSAKTEECVKVAIIDHISDSVADLRKELNKCKQSVSTIQTQIKKLEDRMDFIGENLNEYSDSLESDRFA